MRGIFTAVAALFLSAPALWADASPIDDNNLLAMPEVGAHQLRILSPTVLELTLITTKPPDPAGVTHWNFVDNDSRFVPPPATEFLVSVNGKPVAISAIGFKRRPLYAPLAKRDLRIVNELYLQLAQPLSDGETVEVKEPGSAGVLAGETPALPGSGFTVAMNPLRYSPAIHVNQVGYAPQFPKQAIVGYYLGSLGEMEIPATNFFVADAATGTNVYEGRLKISRDVGYNDSPRPYQLVYEADFSRFIPRDGTGEYKIVVPGLGASFPFFIDEGVPMAFARAYALGLYEQRCGTSNTLPFTRFTHDACHTAPAGVPTPESVFTNTWRWIATYAEQINPNHPPQPALLLTNESAQRFPFVRTGPIDVSGGHHDAGDYSKYTSNSAQLIHYLVFAVDVLPGVAALDNLGIPESGDGIGDVLQEAKWEADFLAKMQDTDGGFYFLVYPRDREYESNVTPDEGDPQVVWPKTTSVTAAAVAALAQCASSPQFKKTYPAAAGRYLAKAELGWKFLTNSIVKYGIDGGYQKITPYSDEFTDHDELAWAACELFLATGDQQIHEQFKSWFPDPADPKTFRWGWWRMFACYGNAIRDYAFAAKSGRLPVSALDTNYLAQCENQVVAAGNDVLKWSEDNAYGTSFPPATKAVRGAGWYFSSDQAFDITVAYQLEPKPDYWDAILRNLNYEGGCNPVNVTFVTGLGWKRQREIVDQYSENDRRMLPKSGIPLGNIQGGFEYLWNYGSELGKLCFPPDGAATAAYPFYDRWGDSHNTATEFTALNLARSLASLAFVATLTPLKTQAWTYAEGEIIGLPAMAIEDTKITVALHIPAGMDETRRRDASAPREPRIVWEAQGQEPAFGTNFTFTPKAYGNHWIEAEAQWPDGRRIFVATNIFVTNHLPTARVIVSAAEISISKHQPARFTFTRTGGADTDLTVSYVLGGTATKWDDYRTDAGDMPAAVTIPAGKDSEMLTVFGMANTTGTKRETMVLTLQPQPEYNIGSPDSATIGIEK